MIAAAAFLMLWTQQPLDADLEQLADDRVDVREAAAARLVDRYPAESAAIRRRAEESTDPEVRARLKGIIASGEFLLDRREFARLLPPRARAAYPGLEADLFSGDLHRRQTALGTIARSGSTVGPPDDPHRWLFLSDGECRKFAPHLAGLLRGGEEAEPVRLAWIDLVSQRPVFLDSFRLRKASSDLFRDGSARVRTNALLKLHRTAAFDPVAPELLRNLDSLDGSQLRLLDQGIVERRLEAGYSYLVRRLRDPEVSGAVAGLILEHDLRVLVPEILRAYEEGVRFDNHLLENLPRAEMRAAILRKLDGTTAEKHLAFSGMAHLRILDQADRVAAELKDPDWSVRSSALAYFQTYGVDASRHAKAVAQCVADYWEGARIGKDPGYAVYAATNLLANWKARAEIDGLIPLIWNKTSVLESLSMIQAVKPAGARKLIGLVDGKDLELSAHVLKLLGELEAKEEFVGRKATVLRILESTEEGSWGDVGRSILFSAARFGIREIIPIVQGWSGDEKRRWNAASALGDLWTVAEKIDAMESDDPWRRYLGIWAVGYKGPKDALDRLWAMSGHPDSEVRQAVAHSLGYFRSDDGVPRLLQLTRDDDPKVAGSAVWSFLDFRCRKEGEPYVSSWPSDYAHSYTLKFKEGKELLNYPHPLIRLAAARGLTPEIARANPELLEPLLRDPDTGVQRVAWELYEANFGPQDPVLMARRVLEWRTDACDLNWSLHRLGARLAPEALGPLVFRFLEDLLEGKREIKERSFNSGMKYDRTILISSACTLLGQCRYRAAEPTLLRLLHDPDPALVHAAIQGLGGIGSEKAVPKLTELLPTKQGRAAAKALGEIGLFAPDFLAPQQEALAMRLEAVRIARHREAFDDVVALLTHPVWAVSRGAVAAIDAMARSEDAVRILGLAYTPFPQTRARLLKILHRIRAPELADEVARFLDDEPQVAIEAARFLAAQRVTLRTDQLPVDPAKVPLAVLGALLPVLGKSEAKPYLPRLLEAIRRPWMERRGSEFVEAAVALARHADPDVLPELLEAVRRFGDDRRYSVYPALAQGYGKAADELFRWELRQKVEYTRLTAARELAAIGAREDQAEIEKWLIETPHGYGRGPDMSALLQGGFDGLARRLLEEHADTPSMAVAAHRGMAEARRKVLDRLRAGFEVGSMLDDLHMAEDPIRWQSLPQWSFRDGVERLEKGVDLRGRSERFALSLATGVRETLNLRALRESWSDYDNLQALVSKLAVAPNRRFAWYWESPGVLRVDTLDHVRDYWIKRFSE